MSPALTRWLLPDARGVDADAAGGREVGGTGAREAEEPGDGRVDALTLEPVGNEHRAGVTHRHARGGAPARRARCPGR